MITLHCQCRDEDGHKCGITFLSIQNGCLMVTSIHDGQRHTNVVTLADIRRLQEEDTRRREPALQI